MGIKYLLSVLALISDVHADQPVHCLRGQVYGVWKFNVSPKTKVNLFDSNEVCTHRLPNKLQVVSHDHEFQFDSEDAYRVKLMDNYQAEAQFCAGGSDDCDSKQIPGTWSTIYDQAFKIELENGQRFLANFKYSVKPEISNKPLQDGESEFISLSTGDYMKFDSQCDKTMVGFVQNVPTITHNSFTMQEHEIQCFFGEQLTHYDMEKTVSVKTDAEDVKIAVITNQNKIEEPADNIALQTEAEINLEMKSQLKAFERSSSFSKRINAHAEHVPSEENDKAISFINNNNFGWTANSCMLQEHHPEYGQHCQTDAVELAQTDIDVEKKRKKFGIKNDTDFQTAFTQVKQWQKDFARPDDIPDEKLPESFDLSDINGYDFTSEVTDQGACGSCYTLSFTQVIESRLKFKYGDETPRLSPQYLMQCNYLNEGCDGGWSFFHGFLAENGHMVSEQCAPYLAKTKGQGCGQYANCTAEAKVLESYFVGGAYGESSERKMMKELLRNGMVNGELNVPRVFAFYQEGILSNDHESKMSSYLEYSGVASQHKVEQQSIPVHEGEKNKGKSALTDRSLEDYGIAWMNLNHSVVIFGWGVDPKTNTKFWRVRNSYGDKWGMSGNFLVRRGENDFGIESETTAYDVVRCQPGNGSQCIAQQP